MSEKQPKDSVEKQKVYKQMQWAATLSLLVFGTGLFALSYLLSGSNPLSIPNSSKSVEIKKWSDDFVLQPKEEGLTLISFWAHWCRPCIEEIPQMKALASESPLLTIYLLNTDTKGTESQQSAREFAQLYQHSSILYDWQNGPQLMSSLGLQALPAHFLVSPSHKILWQKIGALNWNLTEMKSEFERLYKLEATNGSGAN